MYHKRQLPPVRRHNQVPETAGESDVLLPAGLRRAAQRLYAALDHLDAKHRIAFALALIDGKSLAEVAELTGATVVATKTRVWRARRELDRRARKDSILGAYLTELGAEPLEEARDA